MQRWESFCGLLVKSALWFPIFGIFFLAFQASSGIKYQVLLAHEF